MHDNTYDLICKEVVRISKSVAGFIRAELGKVAQQSIETKSRNSFVSYVDKQAEAQLIEALTPLMPGASFLAEEETVKATEADYQWIIDPLDGTTNFLYNLPHFAISIALQHCGETMLGVVIEVNREEVFHAVKGRGAYVNGVPIQVSKKTEMKDALLSTGFPYYDFQHIEAYFRVLKPLLLETGGVRRFGAAALDLAYVACGRYDGYFEYSLHPWDVAAGALLVEEAGGRVGDFQGGDNWLYGQEILVGTPKIYEVLEKMIKKEFYNDVEA